MRFYCYLIALGLPAAKPSPFGCSRREEFTIGGGCCLYRDAEIGTVMEPELRGLWLLLICVAKFFDSNGEAASSRFAVSCREFSASSDLAMESRGGGRSLLIARRLWPSGCWVADLSSPSDYCCLSCLLLMLSWPPTPATLCTPRPCTGTGSLSTPAGLIISMGILLSTESSCASFSVSIWSI